MKQKRICKMSSCSRKHKAKGFCERHYAQFRNGIIDEEGEELRPLLYDANRVCRVEGCSEKQVGRGFCMRHYVQFRRGVIDESGHQLRLIRRYDSTRGCKVEGCDEKHYGLGFCNKHYERHKAGILDRAGHQIRSYKGEPDRLCEVEDCSNPNHARGLCMKHYHRWLRNSKKAAEARPDATPVLRDKAVAARPEAVREIIRSQGAVLVNKGVFEEDSKPSRTTPGPRAHEREETTDREREFAQDSAR